MLEKAAYWIAIFFLTLSHRWENAYLFTVGMALLVHVGIDNFPIRKKKREGRNVH